VTPLRAAAATVHVEVVTDSLNRGCRVDYRDTNDTAPLRLEAENGHVGVVMNC
jgi:hypothetical protein